MSIDDSTPRRGRPPGSKNMSPVEQMLSQPVEVDETSLLVQKDGQEKRPTPKDPDWTKFVLTHLSKEEKDEKNGYPKLEGLKRLVLLLIGNIVYSNSRLDNAPNESNGFNASASHSLRIEGYDDVVYEYTGLGGSNERNTDRPYSKFPESVASNRAKARALREALHINCVAAEELAEVAEQDEDDEESASSTQKNGIKVMCKRAGVDLTKFLNLGDWSFENLDDKSLTKSIAKQMVNLLNKYQDGSKSGETIPEEIKL
jgi:hypothetical protein